jgi:lantibiotic modifying enzyme
MSSNILASPAPTLAGQQGGTWRALLEGNLRERALAVAEAIARRLREGVAAGVGAEEWAAAEGTPNPSLSGGAAGLAVLYAYLAGVRPGQGDGTLAASLLRHAINAVAETPAEAALSSGLAGVGWAVAHLRGPFLPADGEDVNDQIDETLAEHVARSPWPEDYDLIGGLVGLGVYALERLPRPVAVTCLERVIDRLAETAERRPEGVTWWTDPAWLPAETREKYPHGYYNTGLAHGVPGVIALLGCACAAGVAVDQARPLLDGAVRWLLSQSLPGGFPGWVAPDVPPTPTRLAWCYGDPGVAVSLLWAARCVNEPAWEREALAIARRAAERPADRSGVVDAGLCHGAAGLGHLFNRLYQATGEAPFAEAARFWFEQTLTMRHPERGIAGYAAWMPSVAGNKDGWVDEPGLLMGAAGIALALLAAATSGEPAWDRILLVSVPPRSATA